MFTLFSRESSVDDIMSEKKFTLSKQDSLDRLVELVWKYCKCNSLTTEIRSLFPLKASIGQPVQKVF